MSKPKKAAWKRYLKSLTPEQRDKILEEILTHLLWEPDGEFGFRKASKDEEAAIYWTGNGESILK